MLKVQDIMSQNVISCQPETSVKEAARLMRLNDLSGLPVLNEQDELVGILTEADLVKKHEQLHLPTMFGVLGSLVYMDDPSDGDEVEKQLEEILATEVKDLMTTDVVTVSSQAGVDELAEIFLNKGANPVPVVESGRMVGIASRADIIKLIAGEVEENLPEVK